MIFRRPRRCFFAVALLGVALTSLSETASAFCLERTCEDKLCGQESFGCEDEYCERDPDGCIVEGVPLKHSGSCLYFGIESGAGSHFELSDDEFEAVITEAFERWSRLHCGGGLSPGFVIESAGLVASESKLFCAEQPEDNLGVFRSAPPCGDQQSSEDGCWAYDDASLAYTNSSFSKVDGTLFDSDVEFNVAEIVRRGFASDEMREVVLSIAVHEAGHFLGLAHSDNPAAIMASDYSDSSLSSREFHRDDIDAICTAHPPQEAPNACSPSQSLSFVSAKDECAPGLESVQTSCNMGVVRERSISNIWFLLSLALLSLSRRRRA